MKLNFCTLFSANYLSRGLVMYESLLKHCDHFHLYIFAFDDVSYSYLKQQDYQHLTVISLAEFEDEELLRVKPGRTMGEYCWTCTSSTILYCIQQFNLSNCTYLDADMMFYANPRVLIDEMGEQSVLITEHRYTKEYDQSAESGIYCVQFVTFKNDEKGMKVLNWWRNSCIDWCFNRAEDGKFGDQKYLDDWTTRFEGVHELQHLGGGIAPWNVQQYTFHTDKEKIKGTEINTGNSFDVIFFHFHGVQYFDDGIVSLSHPVYYLNKLIKNLFYKPYIRLLNQSKQKVNALDSSFNPNGSAGAAPNEPLSFHLIWKLYKQDLKNSKRLIWGQNIKSHLKHHYFYYFNKI